MKKEASNKTKLDLTKIDTKPVKIVPMRDLSNSPYILKKIESAKKHLATYNPS